MASRFFPFVTVLAVLIAPATARPADAKADAPTVVVRLEPFDRLVEDFKYLADLTGHKDEAGHVDGFLKSLSGNEGLKGIDTKKPIGVYSLPELAENAGVVLVPVTDQKEVLDLLEGVNIKAEKGENGIYTVSMGRQPVYFRFANKYAYASNNDAALAKDKLLDPAKVLDIADAGCIALVVQLDQIPDALKQIALGQFELKVAEEKEKTRPGETEAQAKLKGAVLDDVSKRVSSVVNEGGRFKLSIHVDREANEVSAQMEFGGKAGSKLTSGIAELAKSKSLFAGALGSDSAMSLLLHGALPEALRKQLEPAIDDGIRQSLEKEKDEGRRAVAEKFFKALAPTLKSGEIDVAFGLRGPTEEKLYTFLAGVKLHEGEELDKAVRELVKTLPEKDRDKFKLDAEKADDVAINRLDAQKDFDRNAKRTLGDNPVYFAIRSNELVLSGGPDGLSALKEALSASPKAAPQFQFEMALARLAPLMAAENKAAVAEARKAFGSGNTGNDQVRLTIEGGKSLKLRLVAKAPVLQFVSGVGNKQGPRKLRTPDADPNPSKDQDNK